MAELFGLAGVRFVVIGDGPERNKLQNLFEGAPVSFTGVLTGLELSRAYAALDVFVHFGTEETFGQTIQEAQASGVPVIAPDAGGPSQLIESGVNGILVDPNEPLGYRKALQSLLQSDGRREAIAETAINGVAGRSWASNNRKLIGYYLEAIGITVGKTEAIELA